VLYHNKKASLLKFCYLLFCGCVTSRVIRSALGYLFLLVERVHSTCRHAVWQLQNLHNFLQSNTNVRPHRLGHQRQSLPEALCQVDWTCLRAMIRLLGVIELARDQRRQRKAMHSPSLPKLVQAVWVLMQRIVVCWYLLARLIFASLSWQLLNTHTEIHSLLPYISTVSGSWEHVTPVLRQLHWLPVSRRIDFKLAVLMYQISRGLAPTYLQDRCRLASEVSSGRRLRSANVRVFVVPRTRTKLGDRCFAAAGPRLWNSLPGPLRQSESLATFKRHLKTFLFSY